MSTTTNAPAADFFTFIHAQHAAVFKRYDSATGEFESVGVDGKYGPIHSETGAEYKALAREANRYNADYKVGSSYPENIFVLGETDNDPADHDAVERGLREADLWSENLSPVLLPRADGWQAAFMFRPVESKPDLSTLGDTLTDEFGEEFVWEFGGGKRVDVFTGDDWD
jgi:hypothetical protein